MYVQIRFKALILMFNTLEFQTSCFIKFKRTGYIAYITNVSAKKFWGHLFVHQAKRKNNGRLFTECNLCITLKRNIFREAS